MNSNVSSPRTASEAPAARSVAAHEVKVTAVLVTGAVLVGLLLQVFVPPGPLTLVAASVLAGAVVLVLSFVVPGRIRETISGFRFTSTLLVVLAVMAIGGTLILQGKPAEEYAARYGGFGTAIVALRLDDIFHGLPFALVMALFGAAVISSATLRWPVKARNAGFFVCHVGLITSLVGAGASTLLARRGMVWLPERGESANAVVIEKGRDAGKPAPLGFDIRLDQFDLDRYGSEYRIGFYSAEPDVDQQGRAVMATRLKTSFDACSDGLKCEKPDTARHVLPGGDTFRVKAWYPDYARVARPEGITHGTLSNQWRNPAALVEWTAGGRTREELVFASRPQWLVVQPEQSALMFEKRQEEAKAFTSHVTVTQGGEMRSGIVTVNAPLTVFGWTFYQNSYQPPEKAGRYYTGLEAVHDPGVPWVFTGFFLICVGVAYMFYVEPRLKGRKSAPTAAPSDAAAARAA
ncbi:cytochrome c biogenesis protein ResB [Anaeromyxobacter oryzae]|uniref:cytochrome c biogenesis protein ResB n=1 Tax=Anaeromyxobacter oryzae TaxID=2918170 RepID=UPI0020BEEE0A|nr:cytochrome c biogenesis protein ResB [Anaeromyxobacter oryzae]